ncbi:uncharacterized protein TNCV_2691111 [Trichonephila clavipes]|uniref:Uncharacterized protein n=1 Tax=Trichonephila clavipes TaxID=2585209 RepID=A0A8X6VYM4_TRICX|nr:uncharacterized protein TNCV_2691111 [Trichonephila clavipes]
MERGFDESPNFIISLPDIGGEYIGVAIVPKTISRHLAEVNLKSKRPFRALPLTPEAAVAEWYRYRTVACFVTGSSPVPLKTRRVGQRCTLNLTRAETSSRWCGVVLRRGGASSGVVHVT